MQLNLVVQRAIFTFATTSTRRRAGHISRLPVCAHGHHQRYARQKNLLKEKEENLSGEDVREGLTALISSSSRIAVRGQTKDEARQHESRRWVQQTLNAKLAEFLEEKTPPRAEQSLG